MVNNVLGKVVVIDEDMMGVMLIVEEVFWCGV